MITKATKLYQRLQKLHRRLKKLRKRKLKHWRKNNMLIYYFSHILIGLALCMLFVVIFTCEGGLIAWLLGTDDKKETIQFIAYGMGGVVAAIVATAINRRADAQAENNELIEKGHIDERFKSAIQNLGDNEASVRIASFYQFYYLAKDQPDNFRKSIFDILCSYLRAMPHDQSHITKEDKEHPTEECQTLLNILFKPDDKYVFAKFQADLRKSYLVHTNLSDANFLNANLSYANLSKAVLWRANLSDAILVFTNLSYADLSYAILPNAMLVQANLSGARFVDADLSNAFFSDANLSKANLSNAVFVGTNFHGTQLKGANLMEVRSIRNANFRGAKIGDRPITKDDLPADKGEYYADWNPPPKKEEN